jgi:hypothetical protein
MTGKIQKTLFYTFVLSPNFSHRLQKSTRSQVTLIHPWINLYSSSQKELLIHKPLSLITKTRIRGLDAFTLSFFHLIIMLFFHCTDASILIVSVQPVQLDPSVIDRCFN